MWLPFSRSFTFSALLPYGFTPVGDSMLRRVLNRGGMNKLFQLSVSVSFTLRVICLRYVPVYVTLDFHTVNGECLPCSSISIVSKNRSGAAKSRWCQSGLCFSVAISARWWWVVVSMYDISSPMWCHVLGFGYPILYFCLFKAHLLVSASGVFASLLRGLCSLFYSWKGCYAQTVH
jgi:hypothetical protein